MKIPSVMQGLIETEDGRVFELDSPKGAAWLDTIGSFRYEPTGDGKPYTVRKEGKNGEYWYGCRKIAGKVRKKYIGKSSEVSVVKLEETAEALEIPPVPRTEKVAERVAEVAEVSQVAERVAEVAEVSQVAERVVESRITALELQVATLLKAVEALQEALPGKFEPGDSLELPKVHDEVVERLQNELSNLEAERADRKLIEEEVEILRRSLERSDTLIKLRNQEITTLNSRLAAKDETITEAAEQSDRLERELAEVRSQLEAERADREGIEAELSDLRQKSKNDAASKNFPDFPEAADLLNRLRAQRKTTKVVGADINAILGLLADENGSNLV
ncbi:hypothetical protein QUB10_21210 [Microcoleus sp. B5-D4]|uniref:hypothetical protein n=1 Tax=unclassified Microcoleus TaxID=2642155 RepID=UPI002FD6100A